MTDELKRIRDEAAAEYGLKVSKHQFERGPMTYITGEPRPWSERPDFATMSAFKAGFDYALTQLSRVPEVMAMREAFINAIDMVSSEYCSHGSPCAENVDTCYVAAHIKALAAFNKLVRGE